MLLIKPYIGCNINCSYCYEKNFRKINKPVKKYDLAAILKRMEEFKDMDISLHGGEILTLPKRDVEKLLAKSFELRESSSIQTNATLIDDEYIAMFKKYKTSVGVSWDGPDELSEFRPGTKKVGGIIDKLVKEGIPTSIIIVISRANAGTKARLEKLKKYLLHLQTLKIHGRLNPCLDAKEFEIPMNRLIDVYLDLAQFCIKHNMRWSPFEDIIHGLKGEDRVCYFNGCDPFSTCSAMVVVADGSLTNCMRTNKEGILLRYPATYQTRSEILSKTPQEFGGCQDCPYWKSCQGGCPTGAIDNDWRNRTYLCPLWKALFAHFEKILSYCYVSTVSGKSEDDSCKNQPNRQAAPGQPHGDSPHGDSMHGDHSDSNHGDSHGDYNDVRPAI